VSHYVCSAVTTKIAAFRREGPRDSFRGWLWTITRFKIGDLLRRKERDPIAAGGSDAQQALQELPEQLSKDDSDADSRSLIHRAIELLRPEFEERTWQLFWRVAVDGHAPKDVAAEMGITPDAVRMAKSRVLRRLREELPDLFGE
jgi:RNA polymerase sigma-70 factor, ECF subfamily